jgi:peptidoglycan/xylan/chitin deacetylase (PgdA/CDA1 family)
VRPALVYILASRSALALDNMNSGRPSSDTLVLCYHAVSPAWPADLSIAPDRLRRQLELLVARGYRGVTFTDAVTGPRDGRTVAVTFDDAYRSVFELARPILADLGLPGTVYAPTDHIATGRPMAWPGIDQWASGRHEPELIAMDWEQLGTLAEEGWEVGSHTRSHPHLTQVGDPARLDDELRGSRELVEQRLGRPCRSIAYPYGDHDDRVVEATARAGYTTAGTLPARLTGQGPLRVPRVGIYVDDDERRFRAKVSPAGRRLRASGAWAAAQRVRSALKR